VADPGFDLTGGGRKSLKLLTVEVKSHFSVFLPCFYYNYA